MSVVDYLDMFYSLCYRHKEAAKFLLKAEQWNDAHKLIIQHISAKAIINGMYVLI